MLLTVWKRYIWVEDHLSKNFRELLQSAYTVYWVQDLQVQEVNRWKAQRLVKKGVQIRPKWQNLQKLARRMGVPGPSTYKALYSWLCWPQPPLLKPFYSVGKGPRRSQSRTKNKRAWRARASLLALGEGRPRALRGRHMCAISGARCARIRKLDHVQAIVCVHNIQVTVILSM